MLTNAQLKNINSKTHTKTPSINRSKSNTTITHVKHALSNHIFQNTHNQQKMTLTSPGLIRINSAIKCGNKVKNIHSNSLQKLYLGKVTKPNFIIPHQIRNNPWGDKKPISQNIIAQKGLLEVINMGLLPKDINFTQILNHKYEIKPEIKSMTKEEQDFFPTNPQINTTQQRQQDKDEQFIRNEEKLKTKKKIRKIRAVKSKKQELGPIFLIHQEKIVLQILNQNIQKNQSFREYQRKMRQEGRDIIFKQFISKMEQFSIKYKLKRFQFYPIVDDTKKMTDHLLYKHIVNHNILGIYKAMQGGRQRQMKTIFKMLINRFYYRKALKDLLKIEDIKRYYKIKKYYEEMTIRRTQFLKFKLSSFAENQRRFIQQKNTNFRVEVYIISQNTKSIQNQNSYYKIKERNNIQLTKLFSTKPEHIIILLNDRDVNINVWLKNILQLPGFHPSIEVIETFLPNYDVKNIEQVYYGLRNQKVKKIKSICKNKSTVLIPSSFSITVTKICETLNFNLFGGNFLKEQLYQLIQDLPDDQSFSSQKKNVKERKKMKKLNENRLVNQQFEDKIKIKQFFISNQCLSPFTIFQQDVVNQTQLYELFAETVISQKTINTWVFKLRRERFSRGLAFLETDSIKVLKQKKKKTSINTADLDQVNKYMKDIILDKITLAQNSLYENREEFINLFFKDGGYIESYIENCESPCIFGIINFTGDFQLLGTYKKIYTAQIVNCAAFYPALQINSKIIKKTEELSKKLYTQKSFVGYITFQLLYSKATKQFYFIDMVPSIQQYSSAYSMYSAYFQTQPSPYQEMKIVHDFKKIRQSQHLIGNKLAKSILYCPFIDNNGNKFESIKQFEEVCLNKKLVMNKKILQGIQFLFLNLKQQLPDCLSIFCMGNDEKSAIKYCLQGLNFLIDVGDKVNKFDKKIKRKNKTDCLYINDIIFKLREIKKNIDVQTI